MLPWMQCALQQFKWHDELAVAELEKLQYSVRYKRKLLVCNEKNIIEENVFSDVNNSIAV